MARTEITREMRAAAQDQVDALARAGEKATVNEVLMAMFISNAVETTVELAKAGPRPELDTESARKLYADAATDPVTIIRCLAMARALLRATRPGLSMEKKAHRLAQGLVEMFAAMEIDHLRVDPGIER